MNAFPVKRPAMVAARHSAAYTVEMLWFVLYIGVAALVGIFAVHSRDKRKRRRQLDRIQRELARRAAAGDERDGAR